MLDADQLVERYVLITCSATFAGESGPRARSESVVEVVIHARQSQMRKVKGHGEIVESDLYYQLGYLSPYNP